MTKTTEEAQTITDQLKTTRNNMDSANASQAATWRRAATGVGEGTGLLLDQAKRLESLHHQAEREADVEICVSCTHFYDDAGTLIAAQHVKVHIDDWTVTTDNGQGVTVTEAVSGLKTMLMDGAADVDADGHLLMGGTRV